MAKHINPNDPLQIAKELAIEHGCLCLSLDVSQERDCMRWQCKHDHIWTAPYYQVMKTGTWCPVCEEQEEKKAKHSKRGPKPFNRADRTLIASVSGYGSFSIPMDYEYATLPAIAPASQTKRKRGRPATKSVKTELPKAAPSKRGRPAKKPVAIELPKAAPRKQGRPVTKPVSTELPKAALAKKKRLEALETPELIKPIKLTKDEQAAIDFVLNRTPDDTSDIFGTDDDEQHELSKEENGFLRAHMPTGWCCTEGHEWDATFNAVRVHGFGCPECKALLPTPSYARPKNKSRTGPLGPRRTPAESLKLAQSVAESRDGECLSTTFTRVSDKLTWRCADGHEWNATFNAVMHIGTWCPECAYNEHAEFMKGKQHAKNT